MRHVTMFGGLEDDKVQSSKPTLRRFPTLPAAAFAVLIAGSGAALTYSVVEGTRPVDALEIAKLNRVDLPPLPTIGVPGAVDPEKELLPIAPTTAQEINAARPFSAADNLSAAPFRHALSYADEERAVACLAAAAVYEAGGNSSDQSAVMQVVLNRARHPAFPSSVCGVVFQGSERKTGCQFSFTCDGSMARWKPSQAGWRSAASLARAMLAGHVDKRVGLSTHYHTDWVVPYWSSSLDKVTSVRTHLFFRWQGYWGTPAAFKRKTAPSEPAVRSLSAWSAVHSDAAEATPLLPDGTAAREQELSADTAISTPQTALTEISDPALRRLTLTPGTSAGRWAVKAVTLCSDAPVCRVVGWSDASREPAVLSRASLNQAPPDLVFVKVARNRQQQAYWDCGIWPQVSGSQCLGATSETVRLIFPD